jgi:DNA polymerase-3 subunit beta
MLIDTLARDSLLKPLQLVLGIVERKQSLPILSNVLIEKKEGSFRFTATDLEIQVTTESECSANENYSITLGAKKLSDILSKLSENASISLDASDSKLQLKSGNSKFNLQTLPAQDFPILQKPAGLTQRIVVMQSALRKLILEVKYAMAQQDIRYYLNGVLFSLDGDRLSLVATDGHRLAYSCTTLTESYPRIEAIIPRKAVNELLRLLDDASDEISIGITETSIHAQFSGISFLSKVIDGKFPDYKRVIPEYGNKLLLDRKTILSALVRVSILSNEKFHGVRFILTEKNLKIISSNSEQEEAQEELETDYCESALDIGFNVNYLLDGLNNINSETVLFSFGGANSSVLLTIPDNDCFKYVVMPMRI